MEQMTNLPELNFDSETQAPAPESQQSLPEISNDIWDVVSNTDSPPQDITTFDAASRGINQGVQDFNLSYTANRLVGEGLDKLGFPTWKKKVEAYKKNINDKYAEGEAAHPGAAVGGRIAGAIGATSPALRIGALASVAGRAVPAIVGRMIQGAGQMAATGAAATEGDTFDNIRSYGAAGALMGAIPGGAVASGALGAGAGAGIAAATDNDITTGALVGAGVGVGGYGAVKAVPSLAKAVNAGTGRVAENASDALNLSTELKKEGINFPLTLGDTKKQGLYKSFEYFAMDKIPVIGTASVRNNQLDAYAPTVKSLIAKVAGDKEGTAANVGQIITKEAIKAKNMATQAFNEVTKVSENASAVNITGLKARAQELLQEAKDGLISGKYVKTLQGIIGKSDNIPFKEARTLRTTLGNEVSALSESANKTNGTIVGGVKLAFNSLNKDLDQWGNSNPAVAEVYNKAKTIYKGYKQIFGSKDMHKALADDAAMLDFVKRAATEKNPIRAEKFSKALGSESNQAENRAFVLNEAFNAAYNPHTRILNPVAFVGQLDKTAASNGVRFGKTVDAIKGYTNLLKLGERGFISGQNPTTGYIISSAVTGGSVYGAFQDPSALASVGIPVAILGVIARNPQLFIQAGKISAKTDPTVVKHFQNIVTRRLINAGIISAANQDQP